MRYSLGAAPVVLMAVVPAMYFGVTKLPRMSVAAKPKRSKETKMIAVPDAARVNERPLCATLCHSVSFRFIPFHSVSFRFIRLNSLDVKEAGLNS